MPETAEEKEAREKREAEEEDFKGIPPEMVKDVETILTRREKRTKEEREKDAPKWWRKYLKDQD